MNSLLAGILGNTRVAQAGLGEGSRAQRCMEEVVSSVSRARRLTHRMLACSDDGALSLEPLGAAGLTPESIRTDARATRILYVSDPISPGVTRSITFEDSQAYIENFDKIEEAIQEGTIYFYGITDIGQSVAWEDLKLIATINFGL